MDSLAVLDASALMALLRGEEGADRVIDCLDRAIISSVNLAEVQTKLVDAGMGEEDAWRHIAEVGCASVAFDDDHAHIAGGLVRMTRPLGLSLGDRACLALAIDRKATVYTTDRVWRNLGLAIQVEVIR